MIRANRPANADFNVVVTPKAFGKWGGTVQVADNRHLIDILPVTLPRNIVKIWIKPATDTIYLQWDIQADGITSGYPMVADTQYEVEGYYEQIKRIYLYHADPTNCYIVLFTDDTIAAEYESSGSSASTDSTSSSSLSSNSLSSKSSLSNSSKSSASRSSASLSTNSSDSSATQSSASSNSSSSSSKSTNSSASSYSTNSSSSTSSGQNSSASSNSKSSASTNSSSSSSEST